jgi:hypothetical protein
LLDVGAERLHRIDADVLSHREKGLAHHRYHRGWIRPRFKEDRRESAVVLPRKGAIESGLRRFIDCQREIAFGLIARTPDDYPGGIIRNNFIYRHASLAGDAAIGVFDSPGTQVLHNSILASGTYPSVIEYRFPHTTGVSIANNLIDGAILARDSASATLSGNVTAASPAFFVASSAGNLHLTPAATTAIDRVAALANATTDWDGQLRPHGAAADAGADERVSVAPLSPPRNLRIVR